ncbi:MAG: Flp pilus assembly complex ATPase component TadA [Candidatus Omnitrophica bacterium]|nr:Flp pilus assembly complex ATPase component TadA [Candidatus Omnitrophota bacterium]
MENKKIVRRQRELVDLLLAQKLITADMVEKAREETTRTGMTMDRALEKLGFITAEDIVKTQAQALGIPYMDLSDYIVDKAIVQLLPESVVRKYNAVPLFKIGQTLTVGMLDPQDIVAIDQIRRVSKIELIEPVLVSERGVQRIVEACYGTTKSVDDIIQAMGQARPAGAAMGLTAAATDEAPIIKLVNTIIAQGLRDRASDIHMEPEEETMRVRFRIDGLLREAIVLPRKLQGPVTSRVKILAKLDIAENRRPQDGRIRLKIEDRVLDIRVSTFPTMHGENVVMRLLDKSNVLFGLEETGFSGQDLKVFRQLIRRPNGIILVTGPTGSGKTSSLYSALATINSIEKNIITIEDPVEYEIPLIRQTQVNPAAGITFATGLRSILRQDPDIIMVGEIRDKETVEVAIQAALTGHLVFSTLHTNDAPSALTRLIDIGVEPFLVSSTVAGILAQRLVRLVCDQCREEYVPAGDVLKSINVEPGRKFYRGKGCVKCKQSGYAGRMGIFEFLVVDDLIKRMVDERRSADEIRKKAVEQGMTTLRQDGFMKAQKGLTSLEEVLRVTEEG